jgi:hypothetical protein
MGRFVQRALSPRGTAAISPARTMVYARSRRGIARRGWLNLLVGLGLPMGGFQPIRGCTLLAHGENTPYGCSFPMEFSCARGGRGLVSPQLARTSTNRWRQNPFRGLLRGGFPYSSSPDAEWIRPEAAALLRPDGFAGRTRKDCGPSGFRYAGSPAYRANELVARSLAKREADTIGL